MGAGSRPLCQEEHMNHLGDSKGSKEVTSVTMQKKMLLLLQAYYIGEKD